MGRCRTLHTLTIYRIWVFCTYIHSFSFALSALSIYTYYIHHTANVPCTYCICLSLRRLFVARHIYYNRKEGVFSCGDSPMSINALKSLNRTHHPCVGISYIRESTEISTPDDHHVSPPSRIPRQARGRLPDTP